MFDAPLELDWDRIVHRWPSDFRRAKLSSKSPCRATFEPGERAQNVGSVAQSHLARWVHEFVRSRFLRMAWTEMGGLALLAGRIPRAERWSGKRTASNPIVSQDSTFHRRQLPALKSRRADSSTTFACSKIETRRFIDDICR